MLPRAQRVKKELFTRSLVGARPVFSGYFTIRAAKAHSPEPARFAAVISKKTAPLATDRNRMRRRLQAAFLGLRSDLVSPCVILVFPKKEARPLPFSALKKELREAFKSAGLLKK